MTGKNKIFFLILLGVVLIGLYYLKNTYVVNFFDHRFPLLIKRFYSEDIYLLGQDDTNGMFVLPTLRLWSVAFFTLVITVVHYFFVHILFNNKSISRIFLMICLIIIFIAGMSFFINHLISNPNKFYYIARVLKDFVSGPVLVVLFVILVKVYGTGKVNSK